MTIKVPINQLIHTDNREGLRSLPKDSIPLTVTSPPWDDVRIYGNGSSTEWNFKVFQEVADQLWRVTAPGGMVCWHVGEQIKDGSESGTSSEQRIYFRDLGFRIWQTLVVETLAGHVHKHRYGSAVQYIFVLSKGRPSSVHLLRDRPNKHAGRVNGFYCRRKDGTVHSQATVVVANYGIRGPIWRYNPNRQADEETREHPAPMDETVSRDLIRSFSKPGDLVLDPFAGSATTLKWAMLLGRYYLGFEAIEEYCQLAKRRLDRYRAGLVTLTDPDAV